MPSEATLAYCAYLLWLAAGLCDFLLHWRTDLRHTSGVAESATHLIQLGLLGLAITVGLVFAPGRASVSLILALVLAHAITGYIDTRIAFAKRRVVLPVEQHIHSVLDMAPIIGLAWLVATTWPAAAGEGWRLEMREPAVSTTTWLFVLVPAVALCAVPALLEFATAWKVRTALGPGSLSDTPPPPAARTR